DGNGAAIARRGIIARGRVSGDGIGNSSGFGRVGIARCVGDRRRNFVVSHAAARGRVGNGAVRDLRVVAPSLRAGARVQGDQQIARRTQVEAVADLERRGFRAPARLGQVAGAVGPRPLQVLHV